MTLVCTACGGTIPPEDIDSKQSIARCPSCNLVFDARAGSANERRRIAMPKAITVASDTQRLTITWKWYRPMFLAMAAWTVLWASLMAMTIACMVAGGGFDKHHHVMAPIALSLALERTWPPIAGGFIVMYIWLAGALNRTTITVAHGVLSVRHGPIPWWGACDVATKDIQYVRSKWRNRLSKGAPKIKYWVFARLSNGGSAILLNGLHDADQALFIEQEIDARLKIADARGAGHVG
jgi:hypothetical protein